MAVAGGAALKIGFSAFFKKALASEGAKKLGQGLNKLSNTSRDLLASSGAFKEVGKLFQAGGPAMSMVAAQFTTGTMGARMDLTKSMLNMVQSPGFKLFMDNFSIFASGLMDVAAEIVKITTAIGNAMGPFRDECNRAISALQEAADELSGKNDESNKNEKRTREPETSWVDKLLENLEYYFNQAMQFGGGASFW